MAKKQSNTAEKKEQKPNAFVRFKKYAELSRLELRKVTWPTLSDTKKASIAVLGFVAIMAILLGLVDLGLSTLIKTVLS